MLDAAAAVDLVGYLRKHRQTEHSRLTRLDDYLQPHDRQWKPSWLPNGSPVELKRIARISNVPVLSYVVDAAVQSLYVDDYRLGETTDDPRTTDGDERAELQAWQAWQANQMDARQVAVHRAAVSYGASYVVVTPSEDSPWPAMRGRSPWKMTAVYGDDDRWPVWALENVDVLSGVAWRLWEPGAVHLLAADSNTATPELVSTRQFDLDYVPVVRYRPTAELDDRCLGIVEPLLDLADQVNLTTFSLKVAEHYGAHRQRWIIGWLADTEAQALKTAASTLWQFDPGAGEESRDIKIGEFEQTDLGGYIESREATLRHLATISQTPVHELLGSLANLSAEALVAARDSHARKLVEHKTMLGESHEQTLGVTGELMGQEWDPAASVRWRDMESRSLAQTADALGKIVTMLGVPAEAVWEMIPGVTKDDLQRWKGMADAADPLRELLGTVGRQEAEPAGSLTTGG